MVDNVPQEGKKKDVWRPEVIVSTVLGGEHPKLVDSKLTAAERNELLGRIETGLLTKSLGSKSPFLENSSSSSIEVNTDFIPLNGPMMCSISNILILSFLGSRGDDLQTMHRGGLQAHKAIRP